MNKKIYLICIIVISITGLIVFFNFPDLDIKMVGIGWHRFFLFHSAIIPYVLFLIAVKIAQSDLLKVILYSLCGSFCIAVGAHLFTDIFQSADIYFPVIGSLVKGISLDDRLWILVNLIVCFILGFILYKRLLRIITHTSGGL